MKIAHIAPPWLAIPPKNYGGTEIVIYNLIEEQVAMGHDVTLFAPGDAQTSAKLVSFFPQSLIEAGIPWQAHLKAYYHLYKSVEYIKTHQFDIVHTHLSSSADLYLFPLTANLNTPLLTTLHSRFPFDRVQNWTGDADEYYMEWIKQVPIIAISESAKAEVTHPLQFMGIVHHGIPMAQFRPTVKQPENYLTWLGRFVPEKGAHIAIEVAKITGIPLILAGTIDKHVTESVQYYEEIIKPQVDGKHIQYIGPVGMQQKIDLLSKAKVFLNPISWEEPFGMVMIEAMAVGCPVITFPRGAAPEIVAHKHSGYLAHNMQDMVNYVTKIDRIDRKAVRSYIEHNFSARVMAEKYLKFYRKVQTNALLAKTMPKLSISENEVALSSKSQYTLPTSLKKQLDQLPNTSISALPPLDTDTLS